MTVTHNDVIGAKKFVKFICQKYFPKLIILELMLKEFNQLAADKKGKKDDRKT